MGLTFSRNTLGINNINIFASHGIGDENIKTLAGLFASINIDGAPLIHGFFGETIVKGHALNLVYASIPHIGENLHGSFRFRVFKDNLMSVDLNVYNNITNMTNAFRVSRYGGNICWSFPKGHMLAIGASHTRLFNGLTLDFIFKVNIWKSKSESTCIDFTTNIVHHLQGPMTGHQNAIATLTVSSDFMNVKKPPLQNINEQQI